MNQKYVMCFIVNVALYGLTENGIKNDQISVYIDYDIGYITDQILSDLRLRINHTIFNTTTKVYYLSKIVFLLHK